MNVARLRELAAIASAAEATADRQRSLLAHLQPNDAGEIATALKFAAGELDRLKQADRDLAALLQAAAERIGVLTGQRERQLVDH